MARSPSASIAPLTAGPAGSARRRLTEWGPPALAAVLAIAVTLLGWQGVDHAAQAYRVTEVRQHGLVLWDTGWYGGNYPLGYSVLFPVIGAVLGLPVVAVASAGVAAWAFDRLVTRAFGARPLGSWYFAVSMVLPVSIGQLPFLSGEAAGLAAVLALLRGRRVLAVLLGVMATLCSPLAAAFLALVCGVWACAGSALPILRLRRSLLIVAGVIAVVIAALAVVFPGTGPFPFPWIGLPLPLLLCLVLASPMVEVAPVVRWTALLYAAACVASFMVPNPLGGNAPRLGAAVGVPLLACFLSRPADISRFVHRAASASRWLTGVVLIPFVAWQWAPGLQIVTSGANTPSTQQRFYQPLVDQLAERQPGPQRVEVVPTEQHWEATWVAPEISLARGWERQLDVADNPLFYRPGGLTAAAYHAWLVANGVQWVALPAVPLDYAGVGEAALLRTATVPDLTPAWSSPQWQLWRVTDSPGLVSGPGRLTALGPDHLTLQADEPAILTVRVRFTSLWQVSSGEACVAAGTGGWTEVHAHRAGPVQLSTSLLAKSSSCT